MSVMSDRAKSLPASVQKALDHCIRLIQPEKIILFGSRARGGHRENSDYDIAVFKKDLKQYKWSQMLVDMEEENISLFKIDWVHFEKINSLFQKNIEKEGVILYG